MEETWRCIYWLDTPILVAIHRSASCSSHSASWQFLQLHLVPKLQYHMRSSPEALCNLRHTPIIKKLQSNCIATHVYCVSVHYAYNDEAEKYFQSIIILLFWCIKLIPLQRWANKMKHRAKPAKEHPTVEPMSIHIPKTDTNPPATSDLFPYKCPLSIFWVSDAETWPRARTPFCPF